MQVIILKQKREISYYDPELQDFITSNEPIECSHSFIEEARQVKKDKKIKGGEIVESIANYDELNLLEYE